MSVLRGKKILLGISGGIAAYKTANIVRLFIKSGAEVQVVITPSAKDFVTPLTLSTLSKREVFSAFYQSENQDEKWNNHVELALWADFMVIAPATANTISKMANGICDNLLLAVYLSAKCKIYLAPAMDLDMYKHKSTIENLEKLKSFSNIIIPSEHGELASGLIGEGRMAEPENILKFIENDISENLPLKGKKALVTAGPTYEAIDPVRFIGNHSSGKMGFEVAKTLADNGAEVTLVSGPTNIYIEHPFINIVNVISAEDMYKACDEIYENIDIFVGVAAVADYSPRHVAKQKIKKTEDTFVIEMKKNKDILALLGKRKQHQFLVGFALETENEIENAKSKIQKKNLDLIVLNSLKDKNSGFATDTNKVTFIDKNFIIEELPLQSKEKVAQDIVREILKNTSSN